MFWIPETPVYAEQRENHFPVALSVLVELGRRTENSHVPVDHQKTLMSDDVDVGEMEYQNENCYQNFAYSRANEKNDAYCDLLMMNVDVGVSPNENWNLVDQVTCNVPWDHPGDILPRIHRRVAMKDDNQNGHRNCWGWHGHVAEEDKKEPND